ncbi:MAG: TolC family protein, partial [Pseudomonadota bacterium]
MKVLSRLTVFSLLISSTFTPAFGADALMRDKEPLGVLEEFKGKGEGSEYTLDLKEVLEYTFKHNPTILTARNQLQATQERLPQAYAGWLPNVVSTLGLNKVDIEGSNFPGAVGSTETSMGLSVDQNIFRGGSTFAETAAAKNAIASQIAILDSTEQSVLLNAVTAYMDVVRDRALVELRQHNYNVLERQREATLKRYEVGELTKTDVSQADSRLARAKSDIITARGNLNATTAIFEQIVGLKPHFLDTPMQIAPPIPETLSKAVLFAEDNNPLIAGAVFAHKAAEKDADDVFGELLPQIGAFASWDRAFDPVPGIIEESTTKSIGLSAT